MPPRHVVDRGSLPAGPRRKRHVASRRGLLPAAGPMTAVRPFARARQRLVSARSSCSRVMSERPGISRCCANSYNSSLESASSSLGVSEARSATFNAVSGSFHCSASLDGASPGSVPSYSSIRRSDASIFSSLSLDSALPFVDEHRSQDHKREELEELGLPV